jgi:hypothetical protein
MLINRVKDDMLPTKDVLDVVARKTSLIGLRNRFEPLQATAWS